MIAIAGSLMKPGRLWVMLWRADCMTPKIEVEVSGGVEDAEIAGEAEAAEIAVEIQTWVSGRIVVEAVELNPEIGRAGILNRVSKFWDDVAQGRMLRCHGTSNFEALSLPTRPNNHLSIFSSCLESFKYISIKQTSLSFSSPKPSSPSRSRSACTSTSLSSNTRKKALLGETLCERSINKISWARFLDSIAPQANGNRSVFLISFILLWGKWKNKIAILLQCLIGSCSLYYINILFFFSLSFLLPSSSFSLTFFSPPFPPLSHHEVPFSRLDSSPNLCSLDASRDQESRYKSTKPTRRSFLQGSIKHRFIQRRSSRSKAWCRDKHRRQERRFFLPSFLQVLDH